MVTRNYRAIVEYDGTNYCGFQVQADRVTIQGELERCLGRITQGFVRVNGAGRTDAGVHARGQVISFRTGWTHGCRALQRAMNALLPRDIAVCDVSLAEDDFHARFSATSRVYVYGILNSQVRAPLLGRFCHQASQPLDACAMAEAARSLEGWQDFAAFGQAPAGENTVRVVHRAELCAGKAPFAGWLDSDAAEVLRFEIEANAFLRGMVRRIVGTLVLVGMGRLKVSDFREILVSRDISRAGAPVPGCGLCLWRVRYDADIERDGGHARDDLLDRR